MAHYGKHWRIDGVTAAFIRREEVNGRYSVTFEREYAELPVIEGINWTSPAIEHLVERDEPALPEGYGFAVTNITYDHNTRSYSVTLKTAAQYLGDVTGYQKEIESLAASSAEKDAVIQDLTATVAERDSAIETLEADLAAADELAIALFEASLAQQEQEAGGDTEAETEGNEAEEETV